MQLLHMLQSMLPHSRSISGDSFTGEKGIADLSGCLHALRNLFQNYYYGGHIEISSKMSQIRNLIIWLAISLVRVSNSYTLNQSLYFFECAIDIFATDPLFSTKRNSRTTIPSSRRSAVSKSFELNLPSLNKLFSYESTDSKFHIILDELQKSIGLNFQASPAYAICAILVKGLVYEDTREFSLRTTKMLLDSLLFNGKPWEIIPFIVILLPFCGNDDQNSLKSRVCEYIQREIIDVSESDDTSTNSISVFTEKMFPSEFEVSLFYLLIDSLLEIIEDVNQQLVIYSLIKDAVDELPSKMSYGAEQICISFVKNTKDPNEAVLEIVLNILAITNSIDRNEMRKSDSLEDENWSGFKLLQRNKAQLQSCVISITALLAEFLKKE
eukprot:c14828_g1_i2.p1 GENE.c14828_g1_i2~~c14828_g1_i2.p1  ORF type:complete len:383 (+),score=168.90 c14828_g1_i2:232-1380(+)